uniref:Endoplasmic reticulum lectin n=1 Tax=Propithecus coquereli TaxID=379532 RepID=A0A2K6GZS2_PROCO
MEEGGGGVRNLVPGGPVLLVLCGLLEASGGGRALPPLSDDIPFRVNWPGTEFSLVNHMNQYECICFKGSFVDIFQESEEEKEYKGPNPRELLEPLFKQSSCSYRKCVFRQFCHCVNIIEYTFTNLDGIYIFIYTYFFPAENQILFYTFFFKIPTKNIEGQMTPYYPVGMGNGTPCSLKQNRPRSSTVMYICHPESKHEILSVAEVTTCEYEVVILTPLLCNHPKYRFRASPVNDIFCQSLPGSPFKPLTLRQLEQQEEILRVPFRRSKEEDLQSTKEERFPAIHKPIAIGSQPMLTVGTTHISKLTDDQLIKEFLSGSYCFHGVRSKPEVYIFILQLLLDKDSGKTSVVVGTWNQEEHIEWAKKNTARVYHLQDDGTQTVRCKESDSPHAVTVYMLEPHSCQYILGVESPVICKILDTADENGLLSLPN